MVFRFLPLASVNPRGQRPLFFAAVFPMSRCASCSAECRSLPILVHKLFGQLLRLRGWPPKSVAMGGARNRDSAGPIEQLLRPAGDQRRYPAVRNGLE